MHVSLIVPAPFDTISGGYGYDRRIVAGLREAGHQVDVVELIGAFPMVDDFARDVGLRRVGSIAGRTRNR